MGIEPMSKADSLKLSTSLVYLFYTLLIKADKK